MRDRRIVRARAALGGRGESVMVNQQDDRDTLDIRGQKVDIVKVGELWSFDNPNLALLGKWPTKEGIIRCAETLNGAPS